MTQFLITSPQTLGLRSERVMQAFCRYLTTLLIANYIASVIYQFGAKSFRSPFVHHKSHTDWRDFKPGPQRWDANDCLTHIRRPNVLLGLLDLEHKRTAILRRVQELFASQATPKAWIYDSCNMITCISACNIQNWANDKRRAEVKVLTSRAFPRR
jgi:hypothetical protein